MAADDMSGAQREIEARVEERVKERIRALAQSEARLKEAQRIARVGDWVVDLTTGGLTWSDTLFEIFGRNPARGAPTLAAYYGEIVHPDDSAALQREQEYAIVSGEKRSIDHRFRRPDGGEGWVHIEGVVEYGAGGHAVRIHGTVQDITDRKRAELAIKGLNETLERRVAERTAALGLSEQRFSTLFHACPFSILVADYPQGRIAEVNNAFLRLFGFERADVIGKTTTEIGLWADLDSRAVMVERLRRGEPVEDMEFGFLTKSGERRTVLMSVELVDLGGRAHSLAMSVDVTERKLVEHAMRAISSHLLPLEGVAYYRAAAAQIADLLQADRVLILDRKSTRLNSSHSQQSRMPSSA